MNEIVTFGHPALISKSSDIEEIDDYIINLSKKMIDIMYEAPRSWFSRSSNRNK
jgi:peptide deformylase